MKPFKAIAAKSLNNVIGKDNDLPWRIPEELQWFKKMTLNNILLMGRKTFESMGSRPLPNRKTIILSRSDNTYDNTTTINSLDSLAGLDLDSSKDIWAIGGAEIYRLTLPYCSDLYLTTVKRTIKKGDTFFPEFESFFDSQEIIEDNDLYQITHYHSASPQPL